MVVESLKISTDEDVYLLEELEQVFQVRFTDEEAQSSKTVGDLYEHLNTKISHYEGKKCASSIVFYKVRNALEPITENIKITPNTEISYFSEINPKEFAKFLSGETNFNTKILKYSLAGKLGWLLITTLLLNFVGIYYLKLPIQTYLFNSLFLVVGICLIHFDKMVIDSEIKTIGSLVERLVDKNYGEVLKQGARLTPEKSWDIFLNILTSYSNYDDKELISKDTLLL